MKLPRDLDGEKLAKLPIRFGYRVVRQTGSHMRPAGEEHRLTTPRHKLRSRNSRLDPKRGGPANRHGKEGTNEGTF